LPAPDGSTSGRSLAVPLYSRSVPTTGAGRPPSAWAAFRSTWSIGTGLFILIAAVYVSSSPGRIDIIDGQFRFDVSRNLVRIRRPVISDPFLKGANVPGPDGARYSYYGVAPSVAAMPLVWLGQAGGDPTGERQRFLFSWTSALLGSMACAVLFLFYRRLGVAVSAAVGWTLILAFGTLLWPLAASTFDQAQHALWVLLAVFFGWLSAKRESILLAAGGGVSAGILLNYQESYALILPVLAVSTLAQGSGGHRHCAAAALRCGVFLGASMIGLGAWVLYNQLRFGDPFFTGRTVPLNRKDLSFFGNPVTGLLSLLASPGKSVFLYSPPLLLGFLGLRQLCRREQHLGFVIVCASAVHVVFVSCLSFFGSDWAWGPRYLVPLLPLWALAAPFAVGPASRRALVAAIVAAGVLIQISAVSIDHQRFFLERALPDYFWADDPWSYFKRSALLARPAEILVSVREGVPRTATAFAPGPYRQLLTYTVWSNRPRNLAPEWIHEYKVFYLPRPWPLWMRYVDRTVLPISVGTWTAGLVVLAFFGAGLILVGLRCDRRGGEPPAVAAAEL
jgi:hypothetical protein